MLRNRIERGLKLNGWRSYKPARKTQAILWNIYKRFGEHAALVLTATSLGVLLCIKYEPGVLQHPTYGKYQQMRTVASLMKRETIADQGTGFVWSSARPRSTGKNVVLHLHRWLVNDCIAYLKDAGQEFERQVLTYIVTHHPQRAIRLPRRKPKSCP